MLICQRAHVSLFHGPCEGLGQARPECTQEARRRSPSSALSEVCSAQVEAEEQGGGSHGNGFKVGVLMATNCPCGCGRAIRRIAGLRLRATDSNWVHGDGPEVSGPLISLILAMTGRKGAHPDLSGEGLTTLANRPWTDSSAVQAEQDEATRLQPQLGDPHHRDSDMPVALGMSAVLVSHR